MNRIRARRLLLLAAATAGLLFSLRAVTPRSVHANPAAPDGPDVPVVRFVKNPEPAPPVQGLDLSGNQVDISGWKGKVVIVNFWATWCPPCREEIPELLELKKEYKDRLEIVGLSEDEDPPEKVAKFASQKGISYPIMIATDALIESYGGVPALPTSFLIDPQGRVVQKHSGLYPIEWYHREIRSLLGLPTDARVETFVDLGQVFLKNAANATELPGVSFKGLTPDQKKLALRRLNSETCTCGCKLTLSECRVNDTECPYSGKLAAKVVREVAAGVKPHATPPPAKPGTNTVTEKF